MYMLYIFLIASFIPENKLVMRSHPTLSTLVTFIRTREILTLVTAIVDILCPFKLKPAYLQPNIFCLVYKLTSMVQSSPRPTPMATSTQPHDFLKISKTTLEATMHPNHDMIVIIFFFRFSRGRDFSPKLAQIFFLSIFFFQIFGIHIFYPFFSLSLFFFLP
ncbi:hypothetical protein Hanom_Chr05g00446581 [Helianthus anomalus]